MRVLAATTAGAGHFAGLLPFARACARAGHEVRVAAPASFAAAVEGAGLHHEPVDDVAPAALGAVFGRLPELTRGEANRLVVGEVFGRLDRDAALPGMRRAMDDWRPDVVLREPAEIASYVAAQERGVAHVQTNIGLGAMDDVLLPLVTASLHEVGCSGEGLLTAPRWTVVPPSFDVAASSVTGSVTAAREPASSDQPVPDLPSWWPGADDLPLVYVTFGSVAAGMGLFPGLYVRVLERLADVPARVLLTLGTVGDPAELGTLPPHVHVERWWPQAEVLPHADVVVGHGGFGTTHAALAAGVPQVVLPLFSFDQFVNAERVAAVGNGVALLDDDPEQAGAGGFLPAGPAATDRLADAVQAVLARDDVRERAAALAAEVDALPDTDACVGSLPGAVLPG